MKLNVVLLSAIAGFLLFSSCKKTDDPTGVSVGTFKDSTNGDCLRYVTNGIYVVDSVLTNNNYVDVEIEVTMGGTFEIKSDTINGFSFYKKGTVGKGLNRIRLYASGKPVTAGVNTFTIIYGLSICSFDITVFTGGSAGSAQFTLGGSPGNCSVNAINGNYLVGQALTASNTVETTVNVTTIGTYNITGTSVNGVSFNASGTFTNPGLQNIFLTATGTPATAGTFTHPVSNNTTTCSFPITYTSTITNANFSLSGSPGNCTGAVINGTYTAGTVLNATNEAVIYVNVTSPGVYSISTPTVNGISFSAAGTFNITGLRQLALKGTGTPAVAGTFNYAVSGNASTCTISVITQ